MSRGFMFRSYPEKSLSVLLLSAFIAVPVAAHTIQVSGEVAATFHIEPGHNPKAGERASAWFALTRRGGQTIPLSQCNCQLSVYPKPRTSSTQPVMRPPLRAISAARHRGIPGSDIVFPRAGTYDLVLTGTAKNGANFRPFTLTYTVNVRR